MRYISLITLAFIGINAIVLPNANQVALFIALILAAILNLLYRKKISKKGIRYFFIPWFVTFLYLLIGVFNGATLESVIQTLIVYIVSPVLWILTIDLMFRILDLNKIYICLSIFSILACLTVPVYVWLFQNYGPDSVEFFGRNDGNVLINDEKTGVTMHVLGSLIFLSSAFLAQPNVIKNKVLKIITLCGLVLATLFGGRTMSIVALVIGGAVNFVYGRWLSIGQIFGVFAFFSLVSIGVYLLFGAIGVDVGFLFIDHLEKITGGDVERPAQMAALFNGAAEYFFMGAGHGIGVDYVRSNEFPWRYESVFFALLFKIGIFGLIGLIWPFLIAIKRFFYLNEADKRRVLFFVSAFFCAIFASFTNPYLEAFSFQWMYLLPVYILLHDNSIFKSAIEKNAKY